MTEPRGGSRGTYPPLFENMGLVIRQNLQTRVYGARERPPVSPDFRVPSPPPPNTWIRHCLAPLFFQSHPGALATYTTRHQTVLWLTVTTGSMWPLH